MNTLLLFGSFVILLVSTVPIGIAIGLATLLTIILTGSMTLEFFTREIMTSLDSFPLLAIPFFILAGDIMGKGGLSERLFRLANALVGNKTGGFAIATIITCMFFGAISGSGSATVAAVGAIMIPAMIKHGYDKTFATVTVAAAGSLGVIIPPSIPMVMYGVVAGASIADMFIAGIIPGVLAGIGLMVWAYIYSKKKGYEGSGEKTSLKRIVKEANEAKWALLVPIIILGGIYGGIFTPTEAAVIAVVYGLVAGRFLYKELKITDLPRIIISSAGTTGIVMLITATATAFGRLLTVEQIPNQVANFMLNISQNEIIIIILINLFLLIIGTFMDVVASIIILTPIILPVAVTLGFDPIHFGIIMVVNLAIGMLTPPIGANLFVASGISGISIERLSVFIFPYVIAMIITLMLITFLPSITGLLLN